MSHDTGSDEGPSLVSRRTMEIVVALLLLVVSGVVIADSVRLGFGWQEGEGPAAGYFPFYIALGLGAASIFNLIRGFALKPDAEDGSFVTRVAIGRVLTVLIPSIIYIAAMTWLGLYVASGLFVIFFMIFVGKESPLRAIPIGIALPIFFFMMFEKWFLVPLPKGPLEAMLGY